MKQNCKLWAAFTEPKLRGPLLIKFLNGNYMNRYKVASRGTELNNDQCVENIGNRFDLVLVAAIRARELARQHRNSERTEHINVPVTALLDIQEGRIDREYLKRIR